MPNCDIGGSGDELRAMMRVREGERRGEKGREEKRRVE